jgi:hypothetical protein
MTDPTQIENLETSERPEELTAEEAAAAQGGAGRDAFLRMYCWGNYDVNQGCYIEPAIDNYEQAGTSLWGIK